MLNPIEYVSISLALPYALIPEMPLGIVAHGAAAAIAYRQHRSNWSLTGAKYLLLATVGTGVVIGGYLAVEVGSDEGNLGAAAIAGALGVVAGIVFSGPSFGIYLAVRRGWLAFADRAIERAMTFVVTRFNDIRAWHAERPAARPQRAEKPMRLRRVPGIPVTIKNAAGETETVIVNPNGMTLPAKIHLWAGIARHVAMAGAALYLFYLMPTWLRPIAAGGAAVGEMGGFHLLHLLPHLLGI